MKFNVGDRVTVEGFSNNPGIVTKTETYAKK